MISETEKCSYPGCDRGGGSYVFVNSQKELCSWHGNDWAFIRAHIDTQACIVSALSAAGAARCQIPTLQDELQLLEAMQQRRMIYLMLAGFNPNSK